MKRFNVRERAIVTAMSISIALCTAVNAFAAGIDFVDIPDGHWAKETIQKWVGLGVIQGQDNFLADFTPVKAFNPKNNLTKGDLAIMVDRVMNYQEQAENNYKDLDYRYYRDAVLRATAAGVIQGNEKGEVNPREPVSRQEAFVTLGRTFGISSSNSSATSMFTDSASIPAWARDEIAGMCERDFITGRPLVYEAYTEYEFAGSEPINRVEFVCALDHIVDNIYSEPGEYNVANGSGKITVVNSPNVTLRGVVSGDLIISEGAANGSVTLEGVEVTGDVIVRGGAEIEIKDSKLNSLQVEADDCTVGVDKETAIEEVAVEGDNVTLEAEAGAEIEQIAIEGDNATVKAEEGAEIGSVEVSGKEATVEAGEDTKIDVTETGSIAEEKGSTTTTTTPSTSGGSGSGGSASTALTSATITFTYNSGDETYAITRTSGKIAATTDIKIMKDATEVATFKSTEFSTVKDTLLDSVTNYDALLKSATTQLNNLDTLKKLYKDLVAGMSDSDVTAIADAVLGVPGMTARLGVENTRAAANTYIDSANGTGAFIKLYEAIISNGTPTIETLVRDTIGNMTPDAISTFILDFANAI